MSTTQQHKPIAVGLPRTQPNSCTLYYIKNQQDATLAVLFISHYKITLHVSDPWHAPVAATTFSSTPDDGRRKRPKHVE